MSLEIFHHEEFFLDSGSTHGSTAKAALGRPDLETWDLFTRETFQNSWDARDRKSHDDGVTFSIDYVSLRGHRAQALRDFFGEQTQGISKLKSYLNDLESESLSTLIVADTGTTGLQGPTSAAQHTDGRDDFVAFVRNIGRSSDKELRGGTYGFGKGVFFNLSDTDTILVYTRTVDADGAPVSRFIAMANTDGHTRKSLNYTGRHWWGVEATGVAGNSYANPVTGLEADALAKTFQMDLHFTDQRPTGTSIAMLGPKIDSDEIEDVLQTIANALTKWAWPHMVSKIESMDPIDFSVTLDGATVTVPDPRRDPLLRNFVNAYKLALREPEHLAQVDFVDSFEESGSRAWVDILSRKPHEYLGRLAVKRTSGDGIQQKSILPDETTHHIALIRNPRTVVNYRRTPKGAAEESYAGVFIAASHLDPLFAASEPPAHDEWQPTTVDLRDPKFVNPKTGQTRHSNPVRIALREIDNSLKNSNVKPAENESTANPSSLNQISNQLGTIVSAGSGSSTRVSKPRPVRSQKQSSLVRRSSGVGTKISLDELQSSRMGTIAIFSVEVTLSKTALEQEVKIGVQTGVLVDGKRKTEAEEGIELPRPIGWLRPQDFDATWDVLAGRDIYEDELYRIMRTKTWKGRYAVIQPPNTAITAEVIVAVAPGEEV